MSTSDIAHSIRAIAKEYEEQGYLVTMEPSLPVIGIDLGGYRPDLLAEKGNERIMVDVKRAGERTDTRAYLRLVREVEQHPGWQLLFASVPETEASDSDATFVSNLGTRELRDHLDELESLSGDRKLTALVLPRLWTIYMSALHLLAANWITAADEHGDLNVLGQAYSAGVISYEAYETATRMFKLRSEAIHRLDVTVLPEDCRLLADMIRTTLRQVEVDAAS